ncbi:MAG: tetratricopeptide repeat protein [Planctomycetes bacterium]|nr:tetratricopeptide repeat protein [Planctomycetota bacterium]
MAMVPLRRIFSKLFPKLSQKQVLRQIQDFENVLNMYDMGEFEEAYKTLCDFMKSQPQWSNVIEVYTLWAELALIANDDTCMALELLDRAKELDDSDMSDYYSIHGDVMTRIGNYEKAIEDYERSIAIEPNVNTLTMLAQVLSKVDDNRAANVWHHILEKEPDNCFAHIYTGLEAEKSGDRGKAMLMAKRAEKLSPSVEDIFMIGTLYHELDDFQAAINKYLVANNLGYKDKALVYSHIAACYLSLGDAKPARKYVEWALKCDPEHEYAKEILHEYQEKFGE